MNERSECLKRPEWRMGGGVNLFNGLKWFAVVILAAFATVGFQYFSAWPFGVRVASAAVSSILALVLAGSTQQGLRVIDFLRSAKLEATKVVWPNRQETVQSTIAVVIMVVVASLFVWLVDSLLLYVMSWISA